MWPDADSTRALLDRLALADDPAAADRLWARHREPLRRMIDMRLDHAIGRRVDASDVVQDVLIEASRRLSDYLRNPAMPFHLWLRQIARDRLIDEHRRHRVAARRSLDRERSLAAPEYADRSGFDLAAGLRDGALTPAPPPASAEKPRGGSAWRLDAMDEDDREILLMRHFEGLSNSEAAGALGLSEPAAGMRHLRALRRLRERLGEAPTGSGF